MNFKTNFKVWWYQATDHRHSRTWLELMALPMLFALGFLVRELLDGRPKVQLYLLLVLGVGCLAFFVYCLVGEALFHLRVKRERGKTKIHDLS